MSKENVDFVRQGLEAWARGDMEAVEALAQGHLAPDFEGRPLYLDRVFRSLEGLRELRADLGESWNDYRFENEEIVDLGEHVLVLARITGRGASSGVPIDQPIAVLCAFDDETAIWAKSFESRGQALAAVGLSEEKVDVGLRILRAFNDGDVESFVAECDPTVEWEEQFIAGVDPLYRGHEGVRRWWAAVVVDEGLGSLEGRLEGVKETDDAVIASLRFEAEGTSSGARVQMHVHDLHPWLVEFFDPEIEWHDAPSLPGAAVYHGREAFHRHVEDYLDAWADVRVEIEDISSVGNRVLAHIRYVGIGRQSGMELEDNVVTAVYDLRGGRVLRVRQFVDEVEALAAVGLAE